MTRSGGTPVELKSLRDLLLDQMQDIYDAEKQIIKALSRLAKKASLPDLPAAFQGHLEQTRNHVSRLEQAFEKLGAKAKSKTCEAMKGLIEEGEELMGTKAEASVLDAGLIAAAQKVEHYEMAGYGCLRTR